MSTLLVDAPAAPRTRDRWRRRLAGAAAVVLAAAGAWWLLHPDEFEAGSSLTLPLEVGRPAVIGLAAFPREQVALRGAEPRVVDNSADAEIRVLYCADPLHRMPFGSGRGSAADLCGELPQLRGQHLEDPSADSDVGHLVVEITPRTPGRVVIDGVDVSYTAGLRLGTEHAGMDISVNAD